MTSGREKRGLARAVASRRNKGVNKWGDGRREEKAWRLGQRAKGARQEVETFRPATCVAKCSAASVKRRKEE